MPYQGLPYLVPPPRLLYFVAMCILSCSRWRSDVPGRVAFQDLEFSRKVHSAALRVMRYKAGPCQEAELVALLRRSLRCPLGMKRQFMLLFVALLFMCFVSSRGTVLKMRT